MTTTDSMLGTLFSHTPDSTLRNPTQSDLGCPHCGFTLWVPIAESCHTTLGLYDDSRFPGRSIIRLKDHFEDLSDLPPDTLIGFMRDIQIAQRAIQSVTRSARVNVAILGNREHHVHAHLIPRFPHAEEFPDCSPWNDRRPKKSLGAKKIHSLRSLIVDALNKVDRRRVSRAAVKQQLPAITVTQLDLFDLFDIERLDPR